MIRHIAVIDLGKTNSKVAVVDASAGKEIEIIKQSAASRSEPLYPCLDHEEIETFTVDALRTLSRAHAIDAVTVTTHGATAALLTSSGELALPIMDYEFSAIDELRSEYDKLRPLFSDTGSPSLPGGLNIGAQLYWQQQQYPKQFANASTLLTWPQYWVYRLTGERCNDATSLGCHTDLYEPERQRYSTLVHKQGWAALMPPIKRSGELCGTLTPSIAKRAGLPASTPVFTGIHDSNASLVPHLINQPSPFSVVSTGTWFIGMSIGAQVPQLDEARDTLINVNARGEPVPSARFMGGREREVLEVSGTVEEKTMENFLGGSSASTMLMPSVVTGTGPYPQAQCRWLSVDTEDSDSHRLCATTLYLALMTQECLSLIGADGPIFVEGPLAQDIHYTEMLAAVTNRPVRVGTSATGTSIGAAMLITPPDEKVDDKTIQPNSARRAQLMQYATDWKAQLVNHLR